MTTVSREGRTPGSTGWRERIRKVSPGLFKAEHWRSPLRGPWLTAVLGLALLVGVTVLFVTGILSYASYNPDLPGNDTTPDHGLLGFYLFSWPTRPYWLYRVTQGIHVLLGLTLIPVLLAKLWSVIPRLFEWPPVKSLAQLLERASLLLLVGGSIFEFVTGVLNIQYWYVFPGSFYQLHFYGAWVFIAAFVVHVVLRFPRMLRALRSQHFGVVLRADVAHTTPEPPDPDRLASPHPAAATMSRRGALGLVGAGSLSLLLLTAGQSIGGPFRKTALLAPRGDDPGSGPNGFQVNKTARQVGVVAAATSPSWRLTLRRGARTVELSRPDLLSLRLHTARLPIACVEGWSTDDQAWTGVRLAELAQIAGARDATAVLVESLQPPGAAFGSATLRQNQIVDPDSLLALKVNGADLSLDHGYPARVIVPANPGVHNTKWVNRMTFLA